MKSVHDVIIRPVLTEKAYDGFADKKYVFEVAINATKTEIKQAVEAVFAEDGVKVEKVNTLRTIGKIKRQTCNMREKCQYRIKGGHCNG